MKAYTIPETADVLRCCRASVYNLIGRGHLAVFHVGRSARISGDVLADFMRNGNGRKVQKPSPQPRKESSEVKPVSVETPRVTLQTFDTNLADLRKRVLGKPSHKNQYSYR